MFGISIVHFVIIIIYLLFHYLITEEQLASKVSKFATTFLGRVHTNA